VIAEKIAARLRKDEAALRRQWSQSVPVRHFVVDNLLSPSEAEEVYRNRPASDLLKKKQSLRESKWVGVEIDRYDPSIGECLLAFQHPEVLAAVAAITGVQTLHPDPSLYASGISVMEQNDFLNPHIDNSHDGDQKQYRVLNLLYYVSPDWKLSNGGNLELWTPDLKTPTVVESCFNRLVVMGTTNKSWHSVQRVTAPSPRVCISNYYFANAAIGGTDYRNVTSFRGRPEETMKRILLRADSALLNAVGKVFPFLLTRNKHRRTEK
jgi:Rps23 Pro-64 3,4-dihydroxylase Tpa1-like proline 4-hydroxylase